MQSASGQAVVGLVAGAGRLPFEAARVLREQGALVRAVALEGLAEPDLIADVEALHWVTLGQLGATREALRALSVESLLLVGKVPKTLLEEGEGVFRPDAEALAWLSEIKDLSDESLLGLVGRWLGEQELEVLRQDVALESLLAESGPIAARMPSARERSDLSAGEGALRKLGEAGSGQCVVVSEGRVLTCEEILGTDDAIRRAAAMTESPLTVVKGARPRQDLRFDLPAVGKETVRVMAAAGASALAVEAGRTLLVGREEMLRAADAAGIAVWGFSRVGGDS
ncbi:MAG: LpxI family protein [Myxococcota bacterium]